MNANEPLVYAAEEIRSFLPSGWHVPGVGPDVEGPAGTWDGKKRTWQIRVVDNVDFDWPLVVKADEVAKLGGAAGRIEALRRAMNKVYRERLG